MLAAAAALHGLAALSAVAAEPRSPSRAITGAGVWTTSHEHLLAFLADGTVKDRSLAVLVARSGWESEPLRQALLKPYSIEVQRLAAYLSSDEGERFLAAQVGSYAPFAAPARAVEGLRAALLADAADGTLSAAGIMARLPTDFRLARIGGETDGAMAVCAPQLGAITSEEASLDPAVLARRRTALLSWYAFLPACLQERSYRRGDGVGS